jgi:uncharacterized membrane protein
MPVVIHPPRGVNIGETERKISVVGGLVLLLLTLKGRGRKLPGLIASGYLIERGLTGWCSIYELLGIRRTGHDGAAGIRIERAMTINAPKEDLFAFWRNFENLPRFMKHLEEVRQIDGRTSHWVARAPLGQTVEWDAEIIEAIPSEKVSWRSLPGSQVANSGSVIFKDAPAGRGVEVHVTIQYDPPMGSAGAAVARLLGEEPARQVLDDLRRFKQIMETGEFATVFGQTSARFEAVQAERAERQRRLRQGEAAKLPEGTLPGAALDLMNQPQGE